MCATCFDKQRGNIDVDEGHRILLRESRRKLIVLGTLSLLFGGGLVYLAVLSESLRLGVPGGVFLVSGILMFARVFA